MNLRRIICLALCAILGVCTPCLAQNDTIELSCKSAVLMDYSTGKILYQNNPHEKLPMASVTKIMTMLLAMEEIDAGRMKYTDMITGSAYAKSMGGSTIFLDDGEQLSVDDILKGIAVASGNDAAVAMAEHIAGSCSVFVEKMNQKAQNLGMKNTHFVNCNGLDADGHYSTAYDIALMSRELLKHPDIHKYTTIWMDSLRNGKFTLSNTNKLVRFYDGCTGLKTGSTDKALFCISATARRNGMHLISVIMAAPTSKQRQADASTLLNYGFANYSVKSVVKAGDRVKKVNVSKGTQGHCDVVCKNDVSVLSKKTDNTKFETKIELAKTHNAPLKKGQNAGRIICLKNGKQIGSSNLVYADNIPKITVTYAYGKIIDCWLNK